MSEGARYLTAQEVADRYRLTVGWVYGCRSLPRRKIGHRLRFREDELEEWETRQEPSSRVFGYHVFEHKPVIGKPRVFHNPMSSNDMQGEDGNYVLLFDIL